MPRSSASNTAACRRARPPASPVAKFAIARPSRARVSRANSRFRAGAWCVVMGSQAVDSYNKQSRDASRWHRSSHGVRTARFGGARAPNGVDTPAETERGMTSELLDSFEDASSWTAVASGLAQLSIAAEHATGSTCTDDETEVLAGEVWGVIVFGGASSP